MYVCVTYSVTICFYTQKSHVKFARDKDGGGGGKGVIHKIFREGNLPRESYRKKFSPLYRESCCYIDVERAETPSRSAAN